MDLNRIFKRFEIGRLCHEALAVVPEGLDTRELALAVIRARGVDEADAVLPEPSHSASCRLCRCRKSGGASAARGRGKGSVFGGRG